MQSYNLGKLGQLIIILSIFNLFEFVYFFEGKIVFKVICDFFYINLVRVFCLCNNVEIMGRWCLLKVGVIFIMGYIVFLECRFQGDAFKIVGVFFLLIFQGQIWFLVIVFFSYYL